MFHMIIKHKTVLVRILMLIVFGTSLVAKFLSHEDLANMLTNLFHVSELWGAIISNMLLALEFYIVLQLILSKEIDRIMLQTIIVLLAFTLILFCLEVFTNIDNCYCYGTVLPMNTYVSIIKNIILIVVVAIVIKPNFKFAHMFQLSDVIKYVITAIIFSIAFMKPVNMLAVEYNEITTSQLSQMQNIGKVLIVDARTESIYKKGHIADAVNIPYKGQTVEQAVIPNINHYNFVVIYCDSKLCSLAKMLCEKVQKKYSNVNFSVLKGGYEEWLKRQ